MELAAFNLIRRIIARAAWTYKLSRGSSSLAHLPFAPFLLFLPPFLLLLRQRSETRGGPFVLSIIAMRHASLRGPSNKYPRAVDKAGGRWIETARKATAVWGKRERAKEGDKEKIRRAPNIGGGGGGGGTEEGIDPKCTVLRPRSLCESAVPCGFCHAGCVRVRRVVSKLASSSSSSLPWHLTCVDNRGREKTHLVEVQQLRELQKLSQHRNLHG